MDIKVDRGKSPGGKSGTELTRRENKGKGERTMTRWEVIVVGMGVKNSDESKETWKVHSARRRGCEGEKCRNKEKEGDSYSKNTQRRGKEHGKMGQ